MLYKRFKIGDIFINEEEQMYSSINEDHFPIKDNEIFIILTKYDPEQYICYGINVGYFFAASSWLTTARHLKKIG